VTAQKINPLRFRLSFIILPLTIFVISTALAMAFYGSLPSEVYYRFATDGDPGSSLVAKGVVVAVALGSQVLLVLVAFLLTWSLSRSRFFNQNLASFWFDPTKLFTLMGNMLAIVQIIAAYVLLDIIVYHTQQSHLMPLWLFAVLALLLGSVIIFIYALPIFIRVWRGFSSQRNKKE
jgi:hypothetical protein